MEVLEIELDFVRFFADELGTLRRTRFDPGVDIYQATRREFVDSAPREFARVVEAWHGWELPASAPAGFGSADALWIWPNYWHRYLMFRSGSWNWVDFRPRDDAPAATTPQW